MLRFNLDLRKRRVEMAWYETFGAQFQKTDSDGYIYHTAYISTVTDELAVVRMNLDLYAYPYTVEGDEDVGAVAFGEPFQVKMVYEPVEEVSGSLAVRALRDVDGGTVIGGYLVPWGSAEKRDLYKTYFTPQTDMGLEYYPNPPLMFHHGFDQLLGKAVLGKRILAAADDVGLWVEHWVDKSSRFWQMVKTLLEKGTLYYSPGSADHLYETDDSGQVRTFWVVEDTLTPTPAQVSLQPAEQLRSVFARLKQDLPPFLVIDEPAEGPGGDRPGAESQTWEELRQLEVARLRLARI